MGNDVYPWYIEASLDSSNASAASLIFQTQANVSSDGYVRFTNLGVSSVGNNFKINYNFKLPVGLKQSVDFFSFFFTDWAINKKNHNDFFIFKI